MIASEQTQTQKKKVGRPPVADSKRHEFTVAFRIANEKLEQLSKFKRPNETIHQAARRLMMAFLNAA